MSSAAEHVNRIVQLVAELSRAGAEHEEGLPLSGIAERIGSTPKQVQEDVRTLTAISDDVGAEWLGSLSVWQEGDRVSVTSRGAYRRPIRFTPDEMLAIRVGLAMEGGRSEALAMRLGTALDQPVAEEAAVHVAGPGDGEAAVIALARAAASSRRLLELLYAGERDRTGRRRDIEPHQVVSAEGRTYIVAWCRASNGWRHFRADRVVDAALGDARFERRADFAPVERPEAVLRGGGIEADEVVVRYSPAIARWIVEHVADARRCGDGSVEVTHRVVEPAWLVRTVLYHGADAEVVHPAGYRDVMRRAITPVGPPLSGR